MKDSEKLCKLSSIETDRPSVGWSASLELCHPRRPCEGDRPVCAVPAWPLCAGGVGEGTAEKNLIRAATMFKELHLFSHHTSSFQNQKTSGLLPCSV